MFILVACSKLSSIPLPCFPFFNFGIFLISCSYFAVQCNESEPEKPAVWNELIDVNKQDGSEPYLAVVDSNVIHFMVDHFTGFAVTGEPARRGQTKKAVRIVAYVTPPEADGDCMARVYCVGDTRAHLEVCNVGSIAGLIVF